MRHHRVWALRWWTFRWFPGICYSIWPFISLYIQVWLYPQNKVPKWTCQIRRFVILTDVARSPSTGLKPLSTVPTGSPEVRSEKVVALRTSCHLSWWSLTVVWSRAKCQSGGLHSGSSDWVVRGLPGSLSCSSSTSHLQAGLHRRLILPSQASGRAGPWPRYIPQAEPWGAALLRLVSRGSCASLFASPEWPSGVAAGG